MPRPAYAALAVVVLLLSTSVQVQPAGVTSVQALLSSHWVPGWGFRDELNRGDTDYQNFWTDNAGKILMEGVMTNDTVDAGRAFGFIQSHMTASCYLPEVLVNSSMLQPWVNGGNTSMSNRIVLIQGTNESESELERMSLDDYYAGQWTAGYLGADRIWYNGSAHAAVSATIFSRPDGFVKRAYFTFDGLSFYTYLNVTVAVGDPYVRVSLQVQPMNSTFGAGDHAYLQAFAGSNGNLRQYSFENATVFDADGDLNRAAPFDGATPQTSGGLVIAYSNRTSTLDQDSIALRFNATGVNDIEHWYQDGAFSGLSWVGLGYNINATGRGELSAPVYAEAYPIEHLDYHLLSDTAKYIVSNPSDVSVAPPVSFGFVAEGLALEANLNPNNQTIQRLATGYWNLYYSRYNSSLYSTPYARSINVFALAGFKLYGCNSTVESFTRRFLSNTSGDSIEEYAWAVAALHQLYECTSSQKDYSLYQSFLGSLSAGGPHFMTLVQNSTKNQLNPESTFEFGETASGLMLGGVPFNYPTVISAMNAVYQSNVTGKMLNTPYHGDEMNTETLPAYILSTSLFEGEMRNETGYWITGLENTNVTSIAYSDDVLLIQAVGSAGSSLTVTNKTGSYVYPVEGFETINFTLRPTTTTTTVTQSVTTTVTDTQTATTTRTTTSTTTQISSSVPTWAYAAMAILLIVGLAVGYIVRRPSVSKP